MTQSSRKMGGLLAKAFLGLAVAVCTLPAVQYGQVATLRANAPNEAVRIAPRDARVLTSTLGRRFEGNPGFKPSASDLANIQSALTAQPLEPKLISVLGLAYEAAGKTQRASNLMELAYRASRRDVISGLYLIERASASGDVGKALHHYNAVLTTQPELYPTLLPILASAISYPEIRGALRTYLERGALWTPSFVAAAAESANPENLEALLLPLPEELSRKEYTSGLVKAMYSVALNGKQDAASRFAGSIVRGLSSDELTNPRISTESLDKRLGTLAWTFPLADGIEVEPNAANNSIKIIAEPLSRGMIASRDLLLEGGQTYELRQRLDPASGSGKAVVRWTADCITASGSQRFWEQRLPSNRQQSMYSSVINVPKNCSITRLELTVEGPDDQLASSLIIKDFNLSISI